MQFSFKWNQTVTNLCAQHVRLCQTECFGFGRDGPTDLYVEHLFGWDAIGEQPVALLLAMDGQFAHSFAVASFITLPT